MNKLLEQYSKEIGVDLTIENLIDSHRRLREINSISHKQWLSELEKAREIGIAQAEKIVTERNWININKLKSMTVLELVAFLAE